MSPDKWLNWIFGALGLAILIVDIRRRRISGRVLLDLGPYLWDLGRAVSMLMIVAFGMGLAAALLVNGFSSIAIDWQSLLGQAGFVCAFVPAATRRFQIREAGLWDGVKLIRWEGIGGCELSRIGTLSWKGQDDRWHVFVNVPAERRGEVEKLMTSRCPAQAAS